MDFNEAVESLPPHGAGKLHRAILGACNIGVLEGLSDSVIQSQILSGIKGDRPQATSEIRDALVKIRQEKGQKIEKDPALSIPKHIKIDTQFLIHLMKGQVTEEQVMARSPIALSGHALKDGRLALETLWDFDEYLFIGSRFGQQIQTAGYWWEHFKEWGEFIIPNPLDGDKHQTATGKDSFRCDAAVKELRFCVAEFDNLPLNKQLNIWYNIELPIAAIIYSGGKSYHAWIRIDQNKEILKQVYQFYNKHLLSLGVDPACRNPSRLSRMPGVYRSDKQTVQRIIYLCGEGRAIHG